MITQPTTDKLLLAIVEELKTQIAPDLRSEATRVAVGMLEQLLRGAAMRAAHEIAWMHEEIAAIEAAVGASDDPATGVALAALRALDASSLHLVDVQARYAAASEALSCGIEAAYRAGDDTAIAACKQVLARRTDHEMAIVGQLDLVGRG